MEQDSLYHVFNRGNNKQSIFFKRKNYLFFLKKVRSHMLPFVEILSYSLMPNHFHFLISTDEKFDSKIFSNSFRLMLSSYTRAINKQEERSGSLFQQNTKFKKLDGNSQAFICFNYIHQNPLKAGFVETLKGWKFSSYQDFIGLRKWYSL